MENENEFYTVKCYDGYTWKLNQESYDLFNEINTLLSTKDFQEKALLSDGEMTYFYEKGLKVILTPEYIAVGGTSLITFTTNLRCALTPLIQLTYSNIRQKRLEEVEKEALQRLRENNQALINKAK